MFFSFKKKKNRARHAYLIINSLVMLSTFMLVPIYALFINSMGGSVLHVSIIVSVFYLTASLGSLSINRLIGKLNCNKRLLTVGYLMIGLGYFSLIFAFSFWHLILIQIFLGLADAIIYPSFDALFANNINKAEEQAEWGSFESVRYFTMFAGAIVGGIVVNWAGFDVYLDGFIVYG